MPETCICCFMKYPDPGRVKTRLAADTGDAVACEIYTCLVQDVLHVLSALDAESHLYCHPTEKADLLAGLYGTDRRCLGQEGADLGARMRKALEDSLAAGYGNAVVIGSDIPGLSSGIIREACEVLTENDCVIGPARDGGYYLIGFRKNGFIPAVFDGIAWGTPSVLSETIALLEQAQAVFHILPMLEDIDTIDDLCRYVQRNQNADTHTMRYLREHDVSKKAICI